MKNTNTLWIVILITVAWLAFLLGFGMSSLTGMEAGGVEVPAPAPEAGGYGK